MAEEIAKVGQNVRKWYQRRLATDTSKDYYYILRETGLTQPVLIEYGFVDGPSSEVNLLKNHWQDLAEAIVRAVTIYTGVPYDKSVEGQYTVLKGDSLWSIANKFGITVDALKKANNLNTNILQVGQRLTIPGYAPPELTTTTYVVKKGDSLWSIATAFKVTVDALKKANNLTSTSLSIGQVLKIPGTSTNISGEEEYIMYTVKKRDSLYSIASTYDVSTTEIKTLNKLSSNLLSIGQVLKIPNVGKYIETEPGESASAFAESDTYTVQRGDSLWSIADKYGISTSELKNINNLESNILTVGQVLIIPVTGNLAPTTETYIVQKGDSLWGIANRFNTTVDEIKVLNSLTTDLLMIGQVIYVPARPIVESNTYTVQRGDSLFSVANKFNMTLDQIRKMNNLTSDMLMVGQVLMINENNANDNVSLERQQPTTTKDNLPVIIRYAVQKGDSLWSIAEKYGVTAALLRDLNNLTTDVLRVGQEILVPTTSFEIKSTIEPNMTLYTVKKGDTLWSVAKRFGTTIGYVKQLNNLTSDMISINQQLLVPLTKGLTPSPDTILYIVQEGDTIYAIAHKYNVALDELKNLNNLTTDIIGVGDILTVPIIK